MSPCGMVVDMMRRCYKTKVRFFADNPTEIEIRWFRVQPSAKVLPVPTCFDSRDWQEDREFWPDVGEVNGASRRFDLGECPEWAEGQDFAGDPSWWESGVPFDPTRNMPYGPDDEPLFCGPRTFRCKILDIGATAGISGGAQFERHLLGALGALAGIAATFATDDALAGELGALAPIAATFATDDALAGVLGGLAGIAATFATTDSLAGELGARAGLSSAMQWTRSLDGALGALAGVESEMWWDMMRWIKVTKSYTDFAAAGTSKTILVYAANPDEAIHGVFMQATTNFTGGAIATYTIEVGNSVIGSTRYLTATNVRTGSSVACSGSGGSRTTDVMPETLTLQVDATARTTGANTNAATQGSVDFYLLVSTYK